MDLLERRRKEQGGLIKERCYIALGITTPPRKKVVPSSFVLDVGDLNA
jgi:hypothetical protein